MPASPVATEDKVPWIACTPQHCHVEARAGDHAGDRHGKQTDMTKHSPRKRAIRAYMSAHGVTYTTALRAVEALGTSAATGTVPVPVEIEWTHCRWSNPHPPIVKDGSYIPLVSATGKPGATCATCGEALTPVPHITTHPRRVPWESAHITALKAALATGSEDIINAVLRTNAPGPDPWDLGYGYLTLAHNEATLTEHTSDPESPITADLLRLGLHACGTHGHHRGGSRWFPPAHQIIRAALLARPADQHPVDPTDLAGTLEALAEDHDALTETAREHGIEADYLAEGLLLLAHDLTQPQPKVTPSTGPYHLLHVEAETLNDIDRQGMSVEDLADYRFAPDRTYTITCPGLTPTCEGWEECDQCRFLTDEELDAVEGAGEGVLHGVEHMHLHFGWATATGECSLHRFPDAWIDSATDLDLPPGTYAINFEWDETCMLYLITG